MENKKIEQFPLSKEKSIQGNRRLAREKVMQILNAHFISNVDVDKIFNHIFYREFNFGDEETEKITKLLTQDEVIELEADTPIIWSDDEMEFARKLISFSLLNHDYIFGLIDEFASNWEIERIAMVDRVLMLMALTEILNFSDIPQKVSINESLDIAKIYSTDRSDSFINGIIDSIRERFESENAIHKKGKGLREE